MNEKSTSQACMYLHDRTRNNLKNTVCDKAVPRKLKMKVCIHCFVPHGFPTRFENTDVWLLREDVCQPTCFVQSTMMRGCGLYSLLQYKLLHSAPHRAWQMSVSALWKKTRQGDWQPAQASIQNTSVETERRVKESEWGGAWLSFLSQGHNSLPRKH